MADYVSKVGPCEISGVDHSGSTHEPIVFKTDDSVVSIPDDMQEYAQTLRNALDTGTIKLAPKSPAKKDSK